MARLCWMRIEYAMNPVTPRHSYLGGSPICKRGLEEKIFKPDDGGMPLSALLDSN